MPPFLIAYKVPLAIAGAALLFAVVYLKGADDATQRAKTAAAKAELLWERAAVKAGTAAFERGRASAAADAANNVRVKEIVRYAAQEPDAAAECASVATGQRLHDLQ